MNLLNTTKDMEIQDLREMKLHETVIIDEFTEVLKVHNGWIYYHRIDEKGKFTNGVFVPNY